MKPVLVFICLFPYFSLSIRAKGLNHDVEKIIDEIKIEGGTEYNEENPKICYATLIGKGANLPDKKKAKIVQENSPARN